MVIFPTANGVQENIQTLKTVWNTITADSCPYVYNFHLHTNFSDGQLTPEALMQQALAIGLQGLAITDHHSIGGYLKARTWLEDNYPSYPPKLWIGVEITSRILGTEIHLLGYGFDPSHPKISPYLQGKRPQDESAGAENVIDAIHSAGGLVILAHPCRYHLPYSQLIPAAVHAGIDGVEAYYAYNNPKPWRHSPIETQKVLSLGQEYNLFNTCGTDSHGLNILQRI
ncbi:MAG: hypothetical protein N5P05_002126 [Chroococcopsis gigantea SAG 12.99]|jgi:predicted metal-dependent phosphoesterase TrpH|nr:PHP domain-containing protein [Chlorogloea purpurea SAG 13.99]MDV3000520.1 hypothetical protein [Chroococcopsis gigantea SAG 12.99]